MNRNLLGTLVLAAAGLVLLQSPSLFAATTPAPTKDTFTTKAAAEKRATQLKCTGVHGSGTSWHPCKDPPSRPPGPSWVQGAPLPCASCRPRMTSA